MGMTMAEKILARHAGKNEVKPGEYIWATIDSTMVSRGIARLLKALGIGGIVADSMSRLFFRNAVNIGLPVLSCPGCSGSFREGDQVRVDMETGVVTNLTQGETRRGEALPVESPPARILRAGGLQKLLQEELNNNPS